MSIIQEPNAVLSRVGYGIELRRSLLQVAGAVVIGGALTACGGSQARPRSSRGDSSTDNERFLRTADYDGKTLAFNGEVGKSDYESIFAPLAAVLRPEISSQVDANMTALLARTDQQTRPYYLELTGVQVANIFEVDEDGAKRAERRHVSTGRVLVARLSNNSKRVEGDIWMRRREITVRPGSMALFLDQQGNLKPKDPAAEVDPVRLARTVFVQAGNPRRNGNRAYGYVEMGDQALTYEITSRGQVAFNF